MDFIIHIKDLWVSISGKDILRGVNIEIPRNVVFAIMGPSGSGKSTLLRAMNRILDLYEGVSIRGKVLIDGVDVYNSKTDPSEVRRLVGMVFQIPNPIPNMSIYDNVALGPKINKLVRSRRELDDLIKWALEKAYLWDEVKDRLRLPASKLSGGQQQRLCISRALAMRPKVLLMDEPTSNLDPVASAKIEELIVELKREVTVVLVTHNSFQASRVSDYVAFMYDGQILEVGSTGQIFTRPKNKLTEKYITGRFG